MRSRSSGRGRRPSGISVTRPEKCGSYQGVAARLATQTQNPMSHTPGQVECTIPVIPVRDLPHSIAFYTEKLGFKLDWGGAPNSIICGISRDRHPLMLTQRESVTQPTWVWIGVEDETLFAEYRRKGVKVHQEPQNHPWAYEMKFEDPDGNVLWLGTEPRKDEPFAGAEKS